MSAAGFWACPECGQSSGTPFVCEGLSARPHAPTSVEYGTAPDATPRLLDPMESFCAGLLRSFYRHTGEVQP